jgi:hypothetical protein
MNGLTYLGDVVAYSRAPLNEHERPVREGRGRIVTTLYDIARGHAVLHGRREVNADDLRVPTRVALSTMQKERRPIVRTLLSPETGKELDKNDFEERTSVSKPTLVNRMKLMDTLGLAEYDKGSPNHPSTLTLNEKFFFPDELDFPEF